MAYNMQDQAKYQQDPQQAYPPPQNYQQNGQQQYPPPAGMPPPPNYGGPQQQQDGKQDFNQTFRVEKPKWNDIVFALLFILTFAGFVAVSGIAIQGYSATKLFQGGSIYGGASTVGLSTNTIILL